MAIDATRVTDAQLRAFARKLLIQGCVYSVCWGPDAERLDAAFDIEIADPDPMRSRELPYGTDVATAAAEGDSLDGAIWEAVFSAFPQIGDGDVLLAISESAWAQHIESRLADSQRLNDEVCNAEEDGSEGA
jgi:hypothetical protein